MKRACALVLASLLLAACGGGGAQSQKGSGGGGGGGINTSSPSGGSFNEADYTCPSSDIAQSAGRSSIPAGAWARREPPAAKADAATPGLIAVTYDAGKLAAMRPLAVARELRAGVSLVREFSFSHTGLITRVVRPTNATLEATETALRALPGVRSVGLTGYRRYASAVSTPYFPNDPFFEGQGATGPLYETSSSLGQWDKHVARLEYAFGYSQIGNGSGKVNTNALGSTGIKLAVIDSGEDPQQPEIAPQLAYTKCFITNPDGTQSSSDFETDLIGHGTAVAGEADAAIDNGIGFAGTGGNASLYGYRVFPAPIDACATPESTKPQCGADAIDIASAIEDAIKENVNVINLSLGGGDCETAGVDPDSTEGNAIADAVAANIVVVAAAGNDAPKSDALEAPACDNGVLAVGATALIDGSPNGNGNSNGSATSPSEVIASYSDYGSPGADVQSASAWGIVAPGGSPENDMDQDALHWITTPWTTTPYMSSATDTDFEGSCDDDASSPSDCITLIAGTSLAAPSVAGAAALILAVNSAYQSPAKMKSLLCTTADNINAEHEGCGRLDIDRAMSVAIGDGSEPAGRPIP